MRLLVAIANHGTKNRHYLDQLLKAYREMPYDVSIVVLSDAPKDDLGDDVEVLVGAPSPNPWSLPFAHRPLFRDRLDDYDCFIYTEDDTLITTKNVEAFMEANEILPDNEIAGFIRTERADDGKLSYSGCHSHFRWIPGSVRERGGKLWAELSNHHSACFLATQQQVRKAFASGGFPVEAHEGQYDMLCTAATDIYINCGFKRLVCIDDLERFTLPHLPNVYIGKLGTPEREFNWQINALRKVHAGELPRGEIAIPNTRLPGGMGSKHYRERPDPRIKDLLGSEPMDVLVWASGDGALGAALQEAGHRVWAAPMNAVMGECCEQRGLELHGKGNRYDAVVVTDALHLVKDPGSVLNMLRPLLRSGGRLIARVPNLRNLGMQRRRLTDARFKLPWSQTHIGAIPYKTRKLATLAKETGFSGIKVEVPVRKKFETLNKLSLGAFSDILSGYFYLNCQFDPSKCVVPSYQSSSPRTTEKASSGPVYAASSSKLLPQPKSL